MSDTVFLFACIAYALILVFGGIGTVVATDQWLQRRRHHRFQSHLDEIKKRP